MTPPSYNSPRPRKHYARVSGRRAESWHSAVFAPSTPTPCHVALLGTRGPSRPWSLHTVPPDCLRFGINSRCDTTPSPQLYLEPPLLRGSAGKPLFVSVRVKHQFWYILGFECTFCCSLILHELLPFLSPFFQSFEPSNGLIDTIGCEIADLRLCFFN